MQTLVLKTSARLLMLALLIVALIPAPSHANVQASISTLCSNTNCVFLPLIETKYLVITDAGIEYASKVGVSGRIMAELQNTSATAIYNISLTATVNVKGQLQTYTFFPASRSLAPGHLTIARYQIPGGWFALNDIELIGIQVATAERSGTPTVVGLEVTDITSAPCPVEAYLMCPAISVTNNTDWTVDGVDIYIIRRYYIDPAWHTFMLIPARATRMLPFGGSSVDAVYFGMPYISEISAQASVLP